MILKAFKYRIYPNNSQKVLLEKHFGASRWIYNYALNKKCKAFEERGVFLSRFELQKDIPILKSNEETQWLKDVNSQTLQASLYNLDRAFNNFGNYIQLYTKVKNRYNVSKNKYWWSARIKSLWR